MMAGAMATCSSVTGPTLGDGIKQALWQQVLDQRLQLGTLTLRAA